MRTTILTILAALATALGLAAQNDAAFRIGLKAVKPIVSSGGSASLQLTVEIQRDCEIDQTLLTGMSLDAYSGGGLIGKIDESKDGTVALAAGTKVERMLDVDLAKLPASAPDDGIKSVTFKWAGAEGAEAELRVRASQENLDIATLDLAKTKVRLVTNHGDMTLTFRPDKAPNHVKNFLKLAKTGFYDGTQFHRIIRGFMIQGGCPNTKEGATGRPGTGNPGYTIDAEFNDIKHVRGVLSAARLTAPNTHGCQFFIVHGTASHLDNQYTAFGKLESGFEALDSIANVRTGGRQRSDPMTPVHLYAAVVLPVLN